MIRKNPYYTEIDSNGDKFWYLNDIRYTEIEYNKEITKRNKKRKLK